MSHTARTSLLDLALLIIFLVLLTLVLPIAADPGSSSPAPASGLAIVAAPAQDAHTGNAVPVEYHSPA
jgi:hypothetical protein